MLSLLLLQTAITLGTCDNAPLFDTEHWTRPEICEQADEIWAHIDNYGDAEGWTYYVAPPQKPLSAHESQETYQRACDAYRAVGNPALILVDVGQGETAPLECADYP